MKFKILLIPIWEKFTKFQGNVPFKILLIPIWEKFTKFQGNVPVPFWSNEPFTGLEVESGPSPVVIVFNRVFATQTCHILPDCWLSSG